MKGRVVASWILVSASFLLAAGFGVLTAVCGASEVSSTAPGEPADEPRCVSAFHPGAAVWGAAALLGGAFLAGHFRVPVIVLGGLSTAFGLLSGLSAGFFGLGAGLLLLAAGLVAPPAATKRVT